MSEQRDYALLLEAKRDKCIVAEKIKALLQEYYNKYELALMVETEYRFMQVATNSEYLHSIQVNLKAEL